MHLVEAFDVALSDEEKQEEKEARVLLNQIKNNGNCLIHGCSIHNSYFLKKLIVFVSFKCSGENKKSWPRRNKIHFQKSSEFGIYNQKNI